ncbi:hypothetical protein ACHAXT_007605 [Thalassiosira profunda]
MSLDRPQVDPIISTPLQDADETDSGKAPTTPSPQAVDELHSTAVTSANRSAEVSRLISDHLVEVNSDEIIVSSRTVTIPELEEAATDEHLDSGSDGDAGVATPEGTPLHSPEITTPKHIPPSVPIQHKMLYQSVQALASPIRAEDFMPQLCVGPEREVLFHTESLGIKISRCADGYVRVLSVTPYRAVGSEKVREGDICEGDVVREVSDVNLRLPIDSAVWKLTVGLIKMAPRPLRFVVARELQFGEDGVGSEADAMHAGNRSSMHQPNRSSINAQNDARFGPMREILFREPCLGVKLHRNAEGYVQILSVAPYKSFPNSPWARSGEAKAGDIVLEVGGVWDLREPIDATSWGVLVKFIKETGRPLSMVVAEADCLKEAVEKADTERQVEQLQDQMIQTMI